MCRISSSSTLLKYILLCLYACPTWSLTPYKTTFCLYMKFQLYRRTREWQRKHIWNPEDGGWGIIIWTYAFRNSLVKLGDVKRGREANTAWSPAGRQVRYWDFMNDSGFTATVGGCCFPVVQMKKLNLRDAKLDCPKPRF